MANSDRYVRNRTSGDVFIKGVGVVAGGWEGSVADSDAVTALVGANVLADVKPPADPPTTPKQEAAAEATRLGIDFGDFDSTTEAKIRQLIADHNDKEGGS